MRTRIRRACLLAGCGSLECVSLSGASREGNTQSGRNDRSTQASLLVRCSSEARPRSAGAPVRGEDAAERRPAAARADGGVVQEVRLGAEGPEVGVEEAVDSCQRCSDAPVHVHGVERVVEQIELMKAGGVDAGQLRGGSPCRRAEP